jgi:hypothetical protein
LLVAGAIITGLAGPARAGVGAVDALDADEVIAAWLTLRQWVDAFALPEPRLEAAQIPLANAAGACVIVRQAGRIVGVGVDTSGDELMVRRAAGRAMGEVLADAAVVALRDTAADLNPGRALTLELEIAARPEPLLGKTVEDLADQLEPGLDGVAMRRDDRLEMLFPAQMRAANTADRVEYLLPSLAVKLGLVPTDPQQLVERFGVSMYRFRAMDLAQAGTGDPPFITYRGDEIVPLWEVTPAALRGTARGIAAHLMGTAVPDENVARVMGAYHPVADRYEPMLAPPLDQALVAWALARYGRFELRGGFDDAAAEAMETSRRILNGLRPGASGDYDPLADPVACAAVVVAILEDPRLRAAPELDEVLSTAAARIVDVYAQKDVYAASAPPHGRALIAWAMSRQLAAGVGGLDAAFVRGAIDDAWASVPEPRAISLLPWIGWAEAEYAKAVDKPMAAVGKLQAMRRLADASQVTTQPADLVGGYALTTGNRTTATAQTLRPAALLAWMIRQPELTAEPGEATVALDRVLLTARFEMQLSVRDGSAWSYRNPGRALGGIRAATWDGTQPVAAQALGLVFALETLESIDRAAEQPKAVPGTP